MFRCLSPGAIGINAALEDALTLAANAGFQGLEVSIGEIADRADRSSMGDVKQLFRDAGLRPGAWGLPVNFRAGMDELEADLQRLRRFAAAAAELGCTRTATWLLPASDDLDFEANFAWHRDRLSRVAQVLAEHGCSLGLEFIGPYTLRKERKYPFIYTMSGMLELCEACGPNVGLLLDCWHWYTSRGTVDEIRQLRPEQVVYVHVNDAPVGVPIDEQVDNVRCLPGETGVIDIRGFLQRLRSIGYDGPITPEPFSQKLRQLPPSEAAGETGEAMRRIWLQADLTPR